MVEKSNKSAPVPEKSRIHVVLEARLKNPKGGIKWWNRYIHYSKETRPLTSDIGWMANEGALIQLASETGIEIAVAVLADDLAGELKHEKSITRYKAPYMAFPNAVPLNATLLKQDRDTSIVETKIGWAGINIFPTKEVSLAPM